MSINRTLGTLALVFGLALVLAPEASAQCYSRGGGFSISFGSGGGYVGGGYVGGGLFGGSYCAPTYYAPTYYSSYRYPRYYRPSYRRSYRRRICW